MSLLGSTWDSHKEFSILDKSGTAAYTKQRDAEAGKVSLT